jgi:hypothetical protein
VSDAQGETIVELPPNVGEPLEVYVNGIRQELGLDYEVVDRALVFTRPLSQEGRLGLMRWFSIALGIAGTYRKDESVDVVYENDGRRLVEPGLRPRAATDDLSEL